MSFMSIQADRPVHSERTLELGLRSAVAHLTGPTQLQNRLHASAAPLGLHFEIESATPVQIGHFVDAMVSLCRSADQTFTVSIRLDDRARTCVPGYSPEKLVPDEHIVTVRADQASPLRDYLTFLLGPA